jgi:hypothetical protein
MRRCARAQQKEKSVTEKASGEQWLASRKEAGLKIDPATVEVRWNYAELFDPHGLGLDLPDEYRQIIGRECFARSPGSDIWVWFGDLPKETEKALWAMHGGELAFPAGIADLDGS